MGQTALGIKRTNDFNGLPLFGFLGKRHITPPHVPSLAQHAIASRTYALMSFYIIIIMMMIMMMIYKAY